MTQKHREGKATLLELQNQCESLVVQDSRLLNVKKIKSLYSVEY
jgi:hypothetical protein